MNKHRTTNLKIFWMTLIASPLLSSCAPVSFQFDYERALNQSSRLGQHPILINNNKATNKPIVQVKIDYTKLAEVFNSKVLAFRFALNREDLEKSAFKALTHQFEIDLGQDYASDGSKDGIKSVFLEFKIEGTQKSIPVTAILHLDTIKPQVLAYDLAGGADQTTKNFNFAQLTAKDTGSPITHACIQREKTRPDENDSCWNYLPSSGIIPAQFLQTQKLPYVIGFLKGEYTSYAFVKDEAGNISDLSANKFGRAPANQKTIFFDPPIPPVVTDVHAGNSVNMNYPPQEKELMIKSGDRLFVKWRVIAQTSIREIEIFITQDEKTYLSVRKNLQNRTQDGCLIEAPYTGCAVLDLQSIPSGYFRARLSVTDSNGQVATGSSLPLNAGRFQVLAGNTDSGVDGSATTALLFSGVSTNPYDSDRQSFVITKKGQIVFRDIQQGLMLVDPRDGMYRVLLPFQGSNKPGLIPNQVLQNRWAHLALAYNGEILFSETNRIRALNLDLLTIRDVVGGGSKEEHGTNALDFSYAACSEVCQIYPLPNGDIYFLTAQDYNRAILNGARIRWYSASLAKIFEIIPKGKGTFQDANLDLHDTKYSLGGFQIAFSEATSELTAIQITLMKPVVGGRQFWTSSIHPVTGEALPGEQQIPPAFTSFYDSEAFMNDRTGQLYSFLRITGQIKKLDLQSRQWILVGGTGVLGQCPDLIKASACSMDLQDVFIGINGRIFTSDRGRVRVINADETVSTIIGQSYNFGDSGLATSARFGLINHFDFDKLGRIVISDVFENRLREFYKNGPIAPLAGDGSNGSQTEGQMALNKPIYSYYWGGTSSMALNRENGDVYISGAGSIFQLERSSKKWRSIAGGGGAFPYDGPNSSLQLSMGYPPAVIGAFGDLILGGSHYWSYQSGGFSFGGNLFEVNKTDLRSNPILGSSSPTGPLASAGTAQNRSSMMTTFGNEMGTALFIPSENVWLMAAANSKRILELSRNSHALIKDRTVLPREIKSFSRTTNVLGQEVFYYCSNGVPGRIYKYTPATRSEIPLDWPHSSISCEGNNVHYDEKNQKIMFIMSQNSLSALAEIADTP